MMAGAFLRCGDSVLLMHRGEHKAIAPGLWSCIGGHMEPEEINDPLEACYREIAEETGLTRRAVSKLRPRYIIVHHAGEELRVVHYFTGETARTFPMPECAEGSLHWVRMGDALEKPMSFSVKEIVAHWLAHPDDDALYLCGVNRANDHITWVRL